MVEMQWGDMVRKLDRNEIYRKVEQETALHEKAHTYYNWIKPIERKGWKPDEEGFVFAAELIYSEMPYEVIIRLTASKNDPAREFAYKGILKGLTAYAERKGLKPEEVFRIEIEEDILKIPKDLGILRRFAQEFLERNYEPTTGRRFVY